MPVGSPIPVAFFLTSFGAGGTERQMLELARRLDSSRFRVHIACIHRDGPLASLAESVTDTIAEFPIDSFASAGAARQAVAFARWCRERRLAVLQACGLYSNVFALPPAFAAGVPLRIGSRREINPDKWWALVAAQRVAYGFAHRVVANSRAACRRLRWEGVPARRIALIANGIDLEGYQTPRHAGQIRRLVTVARFRPEKAHDVLIEAFAEAVRAIPDLSLTLVGDGPTQPLVEAAVRRHGLQDRVRFVGHQDAVAGFLRESDLFVLPSRSEALPNAVIEAMAMGLPVIANDVGGIPELVEHGRSGILLRPDRPRDLAHAIVNLARTPSFAFAMGRKARADVAARFSYERMVREFESLYLGGLAGSRVLQAEPTGSGPAETWPRVAG